MTDEEQIIDLYIRYWQYMIDKNADGLRSLQADDYYLMHMTGARQSREVFIRGLLDGTFKGCEDAGSGTFFITSTSGHDVQKIKRT